MRLSHALSTAAVLALSLIQARCPSPSSPPAPGPGAITGSFSVTVGPMLLPGPGPTPPGAACPTGSQRLNTLTLSGTSSTELGRGGDENSERIRVDVTVPDGAYAGTVSPIDPLDRTCGRVGPAIPVTGGWTAAHRALVDKVTTPNCVFESNIAFTSTIALPAGGPALASPGSVNSDASAAIHFELDRVVANVIDGIRHPTTSVPRAPGTSGRCPGDWKLMTDP